MIILGLHKDPWHSTGAAMIRSDDDGVSFAAISEERCNREKDSRKFPLLATRACMAQLGVDSVNDIDLVVLDYIVDRDWRRDFYRSPCNPDTFLKEIDPSRIHVINHHLAHACAVFYSSPFESAAVLIIDGRGSEKETQSLFVATREGVELIESTKTVGVGLLYATVTQAIGFGLLQEGKTMGLAPYGAAVKKRVFDFPRRYKGIVSDYGSVCAEDSYQLSTSHEPIASFEDRARAAFEVQEEAEAALLHLAKYALERTGAKQLCLSGGVALNSVANHTVLRSGLFQDIFINPAASDTGIPLGAALYGYHSIAREGKRYRSIPPYLGPSYSNDRIAAVIESYRGTTFNQQAFPGFSIVDKEALGQAVEMLALNKIVACFQGRSEIGPRALGNRSILMSPLIAENKDILNRHVKHREEFRPFGPSVLEEFAQDYFEIDRPSPYMLLVPKVLKNKRQCIPAVTHVDGTARLQTVSKDFNPYFYSIIERFQKKTGVPVLLNTSFNVANEPMVEAPEDALRCFLSTGIDGLLIGDYLLVK